jgi:hypothetical protein
MTYVKLDITTSEYRLPSGRKFARLPHDYELYGLSRPSRNGSPERTLGLPETVKVSYPIFMPMTLSWQILWVELFSLSKFQTLYNQLGEAERDYINTAFKSVTTGYRAFTNGHGWNDGYCDYINGANLGAAPMEQETITCGGNVVEILGNKERIGGVDVYKVRTLDGSKPAPDPLTIEPWLVFKATVSVRQKVLDSRGRWDGKSYIESAVTPFPQLGGADVVIPFMGKGDFNYISASRIQILPDNSILPSPYRT